VVELKNNRLLFSFPETHSGAALEILFGRTLRVPEDGKVYPLPPSLGDTQLEHIDDFAEKAPRLWLKRGGVLLPLHATETFKLEFRPVDTPQDKVPYSFLVLIGAGKINALTGRGLERRPNFEYQNYISVNKWMDLHGFCSSLGIVKQFSAMPYGIGTTAEEQLTNNNENGGMQLVVFPMTTDAYKNKVIQYRIIEEKRKKLHDSRVRFSLCGVTSIKMGVAPGGLLSQMVKKDSNAPSDWDLGISSRCFAHILNARAWEKITGQKPHAKPPGKKAYKQFGLPWIDAFGDDTDEVEILAGSTIIRKLKSVLGFAKGDIEEQQHLGTAHTPEGGAVLSNVARRRQVREGDDAS